MLEKQQPILYRQLHNSLKHGRLFHAYLFEGEEKGQLEQAATWLMQGFFCLNPQDGDPCLQCSNCQRIATLQHPDVLQVTPSGNSIKVDQIRQLQEEFGKSGMETLKRGFIVLEAEKMSVSAANSLLKFLEEPQVDSLAIFTTSSLGKILPTIQSRVQVMHFTPLEKTAMIEYLQTEKGISKPLAKTLANFSDSVKEAVELSENQWFNEARAKLHSLLKEVEKNNWQSIPMVQNQLLPLVKEKQQQSMAFALFFQLIKESNLSFEKKGSLAEIFLQAQRKWQGNVSFQNAFEQGLLRFLKAR